MSTRIPVPPPLYAIADAEALSPLGLAAGAEAMAAAGVEWIQLRAKRFSGADFYAAVDETLRRIEGSETRIWVDDRVDLGTLLPVAGVHLGQEDLEPQAARRLLPPERWVGFSTHNPGQVRLADADAAVDLVAYGPIFATASKRRPDPVVGLEGLREARRLTGKPLVAIGGIDASQLAAVLAAGADSVAVIGAACGGGNVERSCRQLLAAVEQAQGEAR